MYNIMIIIFINFEYELVLINQNLNYFVQMINSI